jgi:hypothetical protein
MERLVGPDELTRQVDAEFDERRDRLGNLPTCLATQRLLPNPSSCEHNGAWPNLGSAVLVCTIGKSGEPGNRCSL